MDSGCLIFLLVIAAPYIIAALKSGVLNKVIDFFSDRERDKSFPYSYENFFRHLCRNFGQPGESIPLSDGEIEVCNFSYQEHTGHLAFKKRRRPEKLTAYPLDDQLTDFDISRQKIQDASEILEIRIPVKQKFWLRMFRQRLQEQDADEIQTGISELDREYVIHTNQREAAEDFLRRLSVRKYLSNFPCSFDQLEIIHGKLTLTIHDPRTWQMKPWHLEELLKNLFALINEYQEHKVIILQISPTKSEYRCPYCRNPFDENSWPSLQCQNCSTRLHEACWKENGQCTTWGCRSTIPA